MYTPFTSDQWSQKYNSKNPISKFLINQFMTSVLTLVSDSVNYNNTISEIGCGEGHILGLLKNNGYSLIRGLDIDEENVKNAKLNLPDVNINVGNIYKLTPENDSADLIICCEVLEHLDEPGKALEKLCQLSNNYFIVSVPNEPLWRILNTLRLKYVKDFGNSPGHINHWSKNSFIELVSQYADIVKISSPIPFTILLCKKK